MKEINLIPSEIIYAIKWNNRRLFLRSAIFLVTLLIFSWIGISALTSYYRGQIRSNMEILARSRQRRAESEVLKERLKALSVDNERLKKAASAVNSFRAGQVLWSDVIGELTAGGFDGMWFRQFRVTESKKKDKKHIEIIGITSRSGSISELMEFLERSGRYRDVILSEGIAGEIAQKPVYNFSIECKVVER